MLLFVDFPTSPQNTRIFAKSFLLLLKLRVILCAFSGLFPIFVLKHDHFASFCVICSMIVQEYDHTCPEPNARVRLHPWIDHLFQFLMLWFLAHVPLSAWLSQTSKELPALWVTHGHLSCYRARVCSVICSSVIKHCIIDRSSPRTHPCITGSAHQYKYIYLV